MSQTLRQQQIIGWLRENQASTVLDLAEHFQVSDETIRRDLKTLAESGIVEKFHGGVRLNEMAWEAPFERRLLQQAGAKKRIAAAAAELIEDGTTILLDNSSSSCFLARELAARRRGLTAITVSVEVASILSSAGPHHRIILPGGELRAEDRTLVGPSAIEFASRFTPSLFVMSVAAASAGRGCLDFDMFETEFKRAMIPLAERVMLLLDSSKYARQGLIHVCGWPAVNIFVSDAPPPEAIGHSLEHADVLIVR
ncbi:DeoR/GlpR family DNA-binding transcription regulator [Xanthobacteraceae bacterium A53D]